MSFTDTRPAILVSRRRMLTIAAAAAVVAPQGLSTFAAPGAQASAQPAMPEFPAADQVHEIAVSYDQDVYDAMIQSFMDTADKEWIEATLTIDGSTYERVGMRLKGNSSLMVLRGGPEGGPMTRRGPSGDDDGTPPAEPAETTEERDVFESEAVENPQPNDNPLSVDEPEGLPWLIRLDKYVDGQNHNGVVNLVIRSNRTETALNESVALELLDAAGLASQRAAPARFTVNDGPPRYRLAVELPDDPWMARHFSSDGLLYKAEAGGDYSYRGDDPDQYKDVFELEAGGTGDAAADMAPLFAFLAFLNNSDDETFAAELPERLDVDGFATYLAMMDLLANHDDISGPGNNAYLYSDPVTAQITIVPWDMNLAFGPEMGEMVRFQEGEGPPPEGGNFVIMTPGGATPVAGGEMPAEGPQRTPGGPALSNPLVERYTGIAEYAGLVEERTAALRAELYDAGVAAEILSRWVDVLTEGASGLLDTKTIAEESEAVAEFFAEQ